MVSPLMFKMLIYLFLLFSIITAFCIVFGKINLISGKFCPLGLLQPHGFSLHLLNLCCSFADVRVFQLFLYYYLFR